MGTPLFRMIVGSDVHYNAGRKTEIDRFEKGIDLAYRYAKSQEYDKIDALYIVGDFADSGSEDEMLLFKASLDKVVSAETDITLTMASHEYRSNGEEAALEKFARIFSMAPDTHKVFNGFHCIAVTTERGCRIFDKKKEWLSEQLESAAAEDYRKPVFVFQHPHLSGTVYGSINWGEDDIIEILMNYPQVIDFSGHSHAPINDPRNIHQKYFTSVGTGSFSYFELDEFDKMGGTVPPDCGQCAQFLIVEAFEDNSVLIKPFDILSEQFFNEGYYIEKPCDPDSFIYTEDRIKITDKPFFGKNSAVAVSVSDKKIKMFFPQALYKNDIDSYTIKVKDKKDRHIVKQMNISSSYYLNPMPQSRSLEFELKKTGEYVAEVSANSFWNTSSDKITAEFSVD